jgi:hypothetical protein
LSNFMVLGAIEYRDFTLLLPKSIGMLLCGNQRMVTRSTLLW